MASRLLLLDRYETELSRIIIAAVGRRGSCVPQGSDFEDLNQRSVRAIVIFDSCGSAGFPVVLPARRASSAPMLFLASESAFMVRGAEVLTLRLLIDLAWRRTLAYCVRTSIDPRAVTAGRFHMALRESFGLPAAARLAKELPHSPRATAHRFGRFQRQFPMVGMKSVLDWVLYFRFVVGLGLGVSQATRAAELGSCMRSIRRVRVRLAPWLATPPGDLHPWDVIDALRRRLTPPPG